jgi:dihydroceramidase
MKDWLRSYRFALATFGVAAIAAVAFAYLPFNWQGLERTACWPDACFCEAGRQGPVAQPSNTYSNLAFVIVGLLILATDTLRPARTGARGSPTNLLASHRAYALTYGTAVAAIGLGSFFFHASLTLVGRWFDLMGMYLQAGFMVLYGLARLRRIPGPVFALAYGALNAALGWALVSAPQFRREIFGGLILLTIAVEIIVLLRRRPRVRLAYFAAALVSFALAYLIWNLDNSGLWCNPGSWMQGHALWHILSAAAAGLIFLYYRSEHAPLA